MTTRVEPTPVYRRAHGGEGSYTKLNDNPVAYSVALSDLVIADFDAAGAVRGIDVVGKQAHGIERYVELARQASLGPLAKRRGPVPEAN